MKKIPLSAALIVKNEEKNISDCLKSIEWAQEIVILDGFSKDKTVEIAARFTDKIHKREMDIEGIHRNHLYSLCSNEWVLSIDADERVTPELKDEIKDILEQEKKAPRHSAYSIPIKTYIGEKWARHAGWYPAPKIRLFRKDKFKYDKSEIHPRIFLEGTSGILKHDIVHYAFDNLTGLFSDINAQTALQAKEWFRKGKKFSTFTLIRTSIDRFVRKYFFKGGIKGGLLGFILSMADSYYQFMSYTKLWELYDKKKD